MGVYEDAQSAFASLERSLKNHNDAEIRNLDRLKNKAHRHTIAMVMTIEALIRTFGKSKCEFIVETEIIESSKRTRPEDIIAWIEKIGVFVLEVKSHRIEGIRSFENNIPQVVYKGNQGPDSDLLVQPEDFAYSLRAALEKKFKRQDLPLPALFYAGWLPYVSVDDILSRKATINQSKVWLSDMLNPDVISARLERLESITHSAGADRSTLPAFMDLFGCTSGLKDDVTRRVVIPGNIGHFIDQRNIQLKRLTKEQEDLAFSPRLLQGMKVIRGVTGSGKTIVLANAVAEAFLAIFSKTGDLLGSFPPIQNFKILVLCYNRVLAPLLSDLIMKCFKSRKAHESWGIPEMALKVVNIDRYMYHLRFEQLKQMKTPKGRIADLKYQPGKGDIQFQVAELLKNDFPDRRTYDHIFVDEGQDIDFAWYPLIKELSKSGNPVGSITVFYDEAQNIYGVKRPGVGNAPTWKELLGEVPNPAGLKTVMRVCHRNTNEILSFSFNVLLGAFASEDPQMATFAELSNYEKETIPGDPSIDHPNSGKSCVEKIGERHYRINFAVRKGPPPVVRMLQKPDQLEYLRKEVCGLIDQDENNVDPKDILIMCPTTTGVEMVKAILAEARVQWHSPNTPNIDSESLKLDFRRAGITINPVYGQTDCRIGDPRDTLLFQEGKLTISTIKSAKGYTAHICFMVFVEDLAKIAEQSKDRMQATRAEFHVGVTRCTLGLTVLGSPCFLMEEALKSSNDLR